MKQVMKKWMAWTLMCMLVCGLLPTSNDNYVVKAAEAQGAVASADVYVTVAVKGAVAIGKDSKHTVMANVAVHVEDEDKDGSLTFNDAMIATHNTYCKDGYVSSMGKYGLAVDKLWGDESMAFGYYVDHKSAWSAAEPIKNGSSITAFVYKDNMGWSDTYTYLENQSKTVVTNQSVKIKAYSMGYDANWELVAQPCSDAKVGLVGADGKIAKDVENAKQTDANGEVTVAYSKPGVYYVTLYSDTKTLVPAVEKITVYDADTAFANVLKLQEDNMSADVTKNAVYGNEWALLGLARAGKATQEMKDAYAKSVLAKVEKKKGKLDSNYYSTYSKVTLTLTALGYDAANVGKYSVVAPLADYDAVVKQGVTGAAYALLAIQSGNYKLPEVEKGKTQTTTDALVAFLLEKELANGGWAFSGTTADADVTAIVLQALAAQTMDEKVAVAKERALAALSSAQAESGEFASFGTANCDSIAQVVSVMSTLKISPRDDRFVKQGNSAIQALMSYQLADGSFAYVLTGAQAGQTNAYATEDAFLALVSYRRFMSGKTGLYDMSDVKTLKSIPATPTKPVIKKGSISKLSAKKTTMTVKFAKIKNVTGYQVQYSTSSKFTKKKTKTSKTKKQTLSIKKCKKGKTYYVRVRGYVTIAKKTYYGTYSKTKKIKIKK